jgi:uncharacterized membrane protein
VAAECVVHAETKDHLNWELLGEAARVSRCPDCISASIAILTSENLSMRVADRRANLDLQVNLLAEQESTATLQLVRQIAEHRGLMTPADRKAADLAVETNVQDVLDQLERHLPTPGV